MDRIIQEAKYAEEKDEHIALGIATPRGTSKTLMMWSLEYHYSNIVKVFSRVEDVYPVTIGVLDDFGRKFYKRDYTKREQKEFMKLLQVIRTVFPMLIVTLPRWDLMDIDMREFFYEVRVLAVGKLLIFGEEVSIVPAPAEYLYKKIQLDKAGRRESLKSTLLEFK